MSFQHIYVILLCTIFTSMKTAVSLERILFNCLEGNIIDNRDAYVHKSKLVIDRGIWW